MNILLIFINYKKIISELDNWGLFYNRAKDIKFK